MASLDSTSTLAEVKAAYMDNVSYAEDASVSKARAFVTACKLLIMLRPSGMGAGGRNATWDWQAIRQELAQAEAYVAAHNANGSDSVRFLDFSGVRD